MTYLPSPAPICTHLSSSTALLEPVWPLLCLIILELCPILKASNIRNVKSCPPKKRQILNFPPISTNNFITDPKISRSQKAFIENFFTVQCLKQYLSDTCIELKWFISKWTEILSRPFSWLFTFILVLGYRKLSLSIIENFAIFLVIELSIISAKIIDNSLNSIFDKNTGISTQNLK
jgi:hypothetical protein